MNALKSLLPSLLLIAIYFIAEEFFGPAVGACIAFILGCAEFIYIRIREKMYDKMILWTTLFFCVPGFLVFWSGNPLLSRLQAVIIEAALCILTGVLAFSKIDPTATLPLNYRKNLHITTGQKRSMRLTLQILFCLLTLHTISSCLAILYLPEKTADFISGPLLYLWIGVYFLVLFIRNRWLTQKLKKEEWLPLVNEKGEVTGQAPRSLCHSGSKLLHPVVHLHIFNKDQAIFLQKRSMKKDLLPGKWDTAVGGHIGVNEKVEEALKREAFEELGLSGFDARFIGSYIWESPHERELVFSFLCTRYDHIHIDNDEVDEGRFWTVADIEQGIKNEWLTPNFIHEYTSLLKKITNIH